MVDLQLSHSMAFQQATLASVLHAPFSPLCIVVFLSHLLSHTNQRASVCYSNPPKKKRNGTLQWTAKVMRTKEVFPHPNLTPYQVHPCSPFYHTQLRVPFSSSMRVVPLWRYSQSPILLVRFVITRYYQSSFCT